MILKVERFYFLDGLKLVVYFNNNEVRLVDLSQQLQGGVFEKLKDPQFFKLGYLTEWRVIEWPNGADFAPEFLFSIGTNLQGIEGIDDSNHS